METTKPRRDEKIEKNQKKPLPPANPEALRTAKNHQTKP